MQSSAIKKLHPLRRHIRGPQLFLSAWVRAPRHVGSVVPSSRFLSRKIAQQVDPHKPGWVIELGAGTGTITRGLLEAGIKPDRIMAIERDRKLVLHLEQHFPDIRVVRADAVTLAALLMEEKVHKVNSIVCCLPLLSMPKDVVETVLTQVFALLPGGGIMVQYTYGPRSPIPRALQKRLGVKARRAGRVLLNIPPATVWCYQKQ